MRLVSQDKTIDIPYEHMIITVCERASYTNPDKTCGMIIATSASNPDIEYILAEYDTIDMAKFEARGIRSVYEDFVTDFVTECMASDGTYELKQNDDKFHEIYDLITSPPPNNMKRI